MKQIEILDRLSDAADNLEKALFTGLEIADQYGYAGRISPLEAGQIVNIEAINSTDDKIHSMVAWAIDYPSIYTRLQITVDYLMRTDEDIRKLYDALTSEHLAEQEARQQEERPKLARLEIVPHNKRRGQKQ